MITKIFTEAEHKKLLPNAPYTTVGGMRHVDRNYIFAAQASGVEFDAEAVRALPEAEIPSVSGIVFDANGKVVGMADDVDFDAGGTYYVLPAVKVEFNAELPRKAAARKRRKKKAE